MKMLLTFDLANNPFQKKYSYNLKVYKKKNLFIFPSVEGKPFIFSF